MERFNSSIGLAGWGNPTLPESGFTLFLRVHSARNLAAMGRGSYCKLYLGNTEVVNGSAQAGASFSNLLALDHAQSQVQMQPPTHRVFRTKVLYSDQKACPEWNEKLELHVLNPATEILTIRVKSQLMLFCPSVGACAIPLCNVTPGEPAEQWFPLHKAGKPAGHIRLQLLLKEKDPHVGPPPPLAVNESPMQRLIQQHCQQERDRRQSQQSEESTRRQQFEEQERMQAEVRRQQQEAEERERTRMEEMAKMQAFHEHMQREEEAKVQAYLHKQMEHEEDWRVQGLAQKMHEMKVEETPEVVAKEPSSYCFADDVVTASTSRRSSNSSGLKQSFASSLDGNNREQVAEAVVLGEVVHDALPSSDSSSDGEDRKRRSRRKDKKLRKERSRKQSRSATDNQASSPPLFPRSTDPGLREEIPPCSISSASRADSSSSEETSSSEEDRRRRRRRRRKEKKAKRKERRRRHKAKRKARRESDGYESSSSYASSSSSSSSLSSSSSSEDERRKRKARKHKKTKERARSLREGKASSIPRASAPPHANSYGPDHSSYPTNKYSDPPPAYSRADQPQYGAGSSSNYIETLPPQPQQKRTMAEKISTAADVASILSDVASVATSIQQLTGGGDAGGGAGGAGIPFGAPDMSQFLGGQDLSGLAGQDFSGLVGTDTAQYF
ncbi:hypothetical protein PHYPSEUDO_010304 [Phytophthora pseudosyringae]|uniref:C2 domain-containing protein n=1 Tax=Phytophthora pseudosyringae TaxID=221518 RepID=A0A8T1VDD7_9STRA|nr:hypothetical protein PHYPSEUDO_010304 [Phytophthora pseudosyringae]